MKYKEMSKEQQEAFRSLFLNALSIKSQEEQQYTQQFFRLLVLGNGTGIVLLVSFIGANAGKNLPYFSDLVFPLTMFFYRGNIGGSGIFSLNECCKPSYCTYCQSSK